MRRIEGLLRTYFIDALTPLQGKRSYPNVTNNQGGSLLPLVVNPIKAIYQTLWFPITHKLYGINHIR